VSSSLAGGSKYCGMDIESLVIKGNF